MQKARTTVLIPHFRNLNGLKESLRSIWHPVSLNILVVDDGSNIDLDEAGLNAAVGSNCNLFLLRLPVNKGIEYALNKGLEFILDHPTEYIARLDCGDCCRKDRFVLQEEFLDANSDHGIVGSSVRFFNDGETVFTLKYPKLNEQIVKYRFSNSPFCHPAVMFRTKLVLDCGFYSYKYRRAEDYEFFCRFLRISKGANIEAVLVDVELNPNGISRKYRTQQLRSRLTIQWENRQTTSPFFWIGVVKTLLALIMPYLLIKAMKKRLYRN